MSDYIPDKLPRLDYQRIGWQDAPSQATPLDADNLNIMDNGLAALYADVGILDDFVKNGMSDYVTDWLDDHVDPVGSAVILDDSLSIEGAAADAKAVGDALSVALNPLFCVNIVVDDGEVESIDKTYAEIVAAKNAGKYVYASCEGLIYQFGWIDSVEEIVWFNFVSSSNNNSAMDDFQVGVGIDDVYFRSYSSLELDNTLAIPGKAADAKAVGDLTGSLTNLTTTAKTNLVAAINEAAQSGPTYTPVVQNIWTGTCTTTSSTAAKSVTLSRSTGFSYTTGTTVAIYFSNGNSAKNPSLTIQGQNYPVAIATAASSTSNASTTPCCVWGRGLHFFSYYSGKWILMHSDFAVITHILDELGEKASLVSPAFTGNPTAPTQTAGNNSTRVATTAFVQTAISNKIPDPPSTDGNYILTCTVASGEVSYSWELAT